MRDFFYCLIFPHPLNNHRAKLLHPRIFLFVIALFIFSSLFSSALPFAKKSFADVSVQELLKFTNQKRKENGIAPLTQNSVLAQAASKKAEDMFGKNYWAHNSPDGTTPWFFIKEAGYDYVYAGENLARGFNSSKDVVNAWMASPDHRSNLLSPSFKDVGFAVKGGNLSGEETFLVVQEFGSKSFAPVPIDKSKDVSTKKVLGFNFNAFQPRFTISSEIAIGVVFVFISLLLLDMIMIERRKIVRFVGHNFDHAVFLFIILIVIAMFNMGAIL